MFFATVRSKNLPAIRQMLLDKRVNPSANNNEALIWAIQNGELEIVKLLLIHKRIDPSLNNNAVIREAITYIRPEIVKLLLSDPKVHRTVDTNQLIRFPLFYGVTDIVKLLLDDPRTDPSLGHNSAIKNASENGHLEIVRLLLKDPRVNPGDNNNKSIILASQNGHLEIVRLLMADPRVDPSADHNSAINLARRNGHFQVVDLLQTDPRVNLNDPDSKESKLKPQVDFINGLSPEDNKLVEYYTFQGDKGLNYGKKTEQINRLNSLFDRVPALKNDLIVYRGVISEQDSFDTRSNYFYGNFVSTSLNYDVAKDYSGQECCFLTITVPAGSKVLPLYSVSHYPEEEEILLQGKNYYDVFDDSDPSNIQILYLQRQMMTRVKSGWKWGKYFLVESNSALDANDLQDIEVLIFDKGYNQPLPSRVIPSSVKKIIFGSNFQQGIHDQVIPKAVKYVKFVDHYNLPTNHIPATTKVVFGLKKQIQRIHNQENYDYYFEEAVKNNDPDLLANLMESKYFKKSDVTKIIELDGSMAMLNVLASKDSETKSNALIWAIEYKKYKLVRQLLEDPDVDLNYQKGFALKLATSRKEKDIIQMIEQVRK